MNKENLIPKFNLLAWLILFSLLLRLITVYFITALVFTTNNISEGWLQWTKPHTSKLGCELTITLKKDEFMDGVKLYLKNKFVAVKKIECLRYDEAVKRNTALGH